MDHFIKIISCPRALTIPLLKLSSAHTKSLTKLFLEILILCIRVFGITKKVKIDAFLKTDSESLICEKLLFRWSRDQCSAKQEKRLHVLFGLGIG